MGEGSFEDALKCFTIDWSKELEKEDFYFTKPNPINFPQISWQLLINQNLLKL